MSETKSEIEAQRDALLAENENLRGQLAAAGANRAPAPAQHQFTLNQGQLSELETYGVTTVGGRRFTTDQVRDMLEGDQADLEIRDASNPVAPAVDVVNVPIRGVTHVYPSVVPGRIDPAVAGTPGISGPAATDEDLVDYDPAIHGE